MNLLKLFAGQPRDARRRNAGRKFAVESLEGRVVLSAAPVVGAAHAAVQISPFNQPQRFATPANQNGTAFGLQWRGYYDNVTNQYNVNIQDVAGSGKVGINRTATGLQFYTYTYNGTRWVTTTVNGPSVASNVAINIRNFANAGDVSVGLNTGAKTTFKTLPRTLSATVATPTVPIKITYEYNSITNTGTLRVANVVGRGTIYYYKDFLNPNPGDPRPDSPSSNPVNAIQFQLQGNDSYNGGINVFHPGEADPTINVVIDHTGGNYYTLKRGQW